MENTAKGFVAHNAADRNVHFDYFFGATSDMNLGTAALTWYRHHKQKEKWADYWVYIRMHFNGDVDAAFDSNGKLNLVAEYSGGVPVAPPSASMSQIMHLAQKVYRKNRRFTEEDKNYYILKVQTTDEIYEKVNNTIVKKVTADALRSGFTREEFDNLQIIANDEGWSPIDLLQGESSRFGVAVQNVKDWLGLLK